MERKEAIEVVKKNWPDSSFTMLREALETLVPELKESEDERIRKELICFLNTEIPQCEARDKYTSWLEKQGEQEVNEPDWCHHKVDLSDCSEEYRKAYYDGWNNCNQQHSQCNAEQKPAEWKQENVEELSEFENAMMHIGYSFFGKRGGLDPNDTSSVKVQAQYLLELAQKPAAWSEEDEEFLRRATNAAKDVYPMTANWLKSLKERCAWKPSDEQMKQLGWIAEQNKDNMIGKELISLYQDLKKLREG